MAEKKIDIVIPWVDGSDPAWRTEFDHCRRLCIPQSEHLADIQSGSSSGGKAKVEALNNTSTQNSLPGTERTNADTGEERYRDWDTLMYIFRGIEKFAPWVNRVHLITWGHIPAWLDTSHPKLNIVNHRDYIPPEYLPTFSSAPIEINMHRIDGLAERFIYFNDDTFLCKPTPPSRYFRKGLPVDIARLNVIRTTKVDHNILECVRVTNLEHDKRKSVRANIGKWINFRYSPGDLIKTMTLMGWSFFTGFKDHHTPQPFLKSTFEALWQRRFAELDASSRSRFRTPTDLVQWVFRYDQLASGRFSPHGYRDTIQMEVTDESVSGVAQAIKSGKYTAVCLHDNAGIRDFGKVKSEVKAALDYILPEKSEYEL